MRRDSLPWLVGAAFFVVGFFGLHGAACNMHMAAVEMLRSDTNNPAAYAMSYDYCSVVGAPLRALTGEP